MARRSSRKIPPTQPEPIGSDVGIMALDTRTAGAAGSACTVLYVHGAGNKPPEPVLRCLWDRALLGRPMGDRIRMAYWVNHARHGPPMEDACHGEDHSVPLGALRQHLLSPADPDPGHEALIARLCRASADGGESEADARAFLRSVHDAIATQVGPGCIGARGAGDDFLSGLSSLFTSAFLCDVHDFFFDPRARDRMRRALLDVIEPGGAPFVVIGHSLGSLIAYDVLRGLDPARWPVALFVTLGCPLGLGPVRARFRQWTGQRKLHVPGCVRRWINVANRGDVVCADTDLSDDIVANERFENRIVDSPNHELRNDKHSATGYLRLATVRDPVRDAVGTAFAQPVGLQVIAADLIEAMEDGPRSTRHPVLIELVARADDGNADVHVLRKRLERRIGELVARRDGSADAEAVIDHLNHWLSVELTRPEIERLRTEFASLSIRRIWRDAEKSASIERSSATVQVRPANLAYDALGRGVTWAVLDTGVRADHPHFSRHGTVVSVWDCTLPGKAPAPLDPTPASAKAARRLDPNGHGTHVAGIIAGSGAVSAARGDLPRNFAGMAPCAELIAFKVLDDSGTGHDSWIIKALDKIADLNERAGHLVVHGVNLSLGGYFDPSVYACEHTPLCTELRRLWRQGVLVVLAAGNEGHALLSTEDGSAWPSNIDLSIGDPANLSEAITVGSVHRTNPHTYGVSYFSSRGPTADGRCKPDVVAPGEKILSARHDWRRRRKAGTRYAVDDLYVEMSGTSAAAAHVSGLLAAFLSVRGEFIGRPDHVKRLLMQHCTDLNRDRYVQGNGLPNLMRMLAMT